MEGNQIVKLKRECQATQIPSGMKVRLPAGLEVRITQSLGGAYTVVTEDGAMLRLAAEEADALGKEAESVSQPVKAEAVSLSLQEVEKRVWDQLRTVFDPEIPVNVVDLGLVYLCLVLPLPEGGHKVEVKMTLTAPGCGMGSVLQADAQSKILSVPGVKTAQVEMVVDPPWNQSRMSEAAKLQLGLL